MDINLYSPAGLRRLLGEESAAPLKKYGQNFLINPAVVERMIAESGLTGADGVLEIGPGPGALTSRLVPAARRVVAVEIDRKMVAVLKTTAPGAEVLEADIMRLDLAALIAEKFADCERVLVFGNLPYYITSPLLMLLIEQELPIASVTAMVQKEAAARLCAGRAAARAEPSRWPCATAAGRASCSTCPAAASTRFRGWTAASSSWCPSAAPSVR